MVLEVALKLTRICLQDEELLTFKTGFGDSLARAYVVPTRNGKDRYPPPSSPDLQRMGINRIFPSQINL
jgi:hypothetical protein